MSEKKTFLLEKNSKVLMNFYNLKRKDIKIKIKNNDKIKLLKNIKIIDSSSFQFEDLIEDGEYIILLKNKIFQKFTLTIDKKPMINFFEKPKINDDFKLNESQVDSKKNYPMDKLDSMNVTIADFGATCTEDEFYENQFGTRYYMSPEVILMGKVSEKIDIWALGCILYELINGQFLFDPDKDKTYSRDYYHLIEISKVSGRFSKKFLKTTKHYKKFFERTGDIYDTEFREYYDHNELFDKVKDEKDKGLVIDLISKMLKIDPKERISITDILSHEWLNDNNNANNNLPLNTT